MTARHWILSGILAALTACTPVMEDPIIEEPVILEDAVIEAAPVARCPEDDDGIGGTGCSVD